MEDNNQDDSPGGISGGSLDFLAIPIKIQLSIHTTKSAPKFGSMLYMKGDKYVFDDPMTIWLPFEHIVAAINALMLDDDHHLQETTDTGVHLFLNNKPPKNPGVTTDGFRTSKPLEICPICSSNVWTKAIKESAYVSYVGSGCIDLAHSEFNEQVIEYPVLDLICCMKKLPSQLTPSNPTATNRQASTSVADKKLYI
jgi:hypothetical protein